MIITSSKIISCKPVHTSAFEQAVVINKGIIQAVGASQQITQQFPHHRVYQLRNAVLMPGLVNVHTHTELPELLKTIRSRTFPDWILNLINAKKGLSLKNYTSATAKNINTIIQTGTTTIGEICTQGISPTLLKQSGLRALVFHEIIKMGTETTGKRSGRQLPLGTDSVLVKFGLSPHSPYTVSETVLRNIVTLANKKHLRIAMHVAESRDELKLLWRNKSGLAKLYKLASWDIDSAPTGSSSFEYLNRIGFLSPRLLAVHAVQVTDEDIVLIKKSNVSVAHCPRSNKETGVGRMPLKKFLDSGVTVGLGTDSLASSPNLSMWDEMRYACKIHRRDGITAKDILTLVTVGGAKALGLAEEIGTIEPGKKADIIAVPLPSKNTGDIYSDLLRETKSCIMAMVNGKILHRAL
jgi:cytosine/adenosine deaminase-related metal-dependent hydrolase